MPTVRCARVQHELFRSAVGVALALVTAAGPLLDSLHEASVRHVACPEDGELIDAPVEPAHGHGRPAASAPGLSSAEDPSALHSAGGSHGHCAIALHSHLRARGDSAQRPAGHPAALATSICASPDPVFVRLAVYRVAPKASPPQA